MLSIYQSYVAKSRYARFLPSLNRRENLHETVQRYVEFMCHAIENEYGLELFDLRAELKEEICSLNVMPSMRAMMTAGKALERDNTAGFNCSYLPVDDIKAFDEALFILMCGCGVGFSVERQNVNKLPEVPDQLFESGPTIVVRDSKEGWAKALRMFIALLYSGEIPKWDLSKIRPAGVPLKIFGGRASGPLPLEDLFKFIILIFKDAKGRKLTSIECHDIMCKIAEIVVCGGVRRCLKKDTIVQMQNGYKKIQDIKIGDFIVTGGKAYPVIGHVYSGKQPILNIQHKFGELKCTENHQVAVFNSVSNEYSFKLAKNISVGEALVWDSHGIKGIPQQYLPEFEQNNHFNAKQIIFNDKLTTDFAWLIGLIHGDGYVSERGVEISNLEEDILEKANKVFKEFFDITGNISEGKGCLRLRINSKSIEMWYKKYIKKPNESISIPSFIFNASKEIRESYLAGLFDADGRITSDGGIEQVTTIYNEFRKDIINLLNSLGIASKWFFYSPEKRRENGINAQDYYTIRIVGRINRQKWDNVAKFCLSKKINKLKEAIGVHNDFSWPYKLHQNKAWKKHTMSFLTSVDKGLVENKGYYPSEVTEITLESEDDTYDIEVDEIHQFTTDGIVVHNSALISLSNLSDDRMRHAKAGQWWIADPQRALSNNSAVYTEKPDVGAFMKEWLSIYESKSGERGIFSRAAAKKVAARNGRRDPNYEWGCNPSLRKGTKVWTDKGVFPIEELEGENFYVRNLYGKLSFASCWLSGKNKELWKVTLAGGHVYYATAEHKWPVIYNNKVVKVPTNELIEGSHLPLIKTEKLSDGYKGNYEDGFVIGWNLGDGWITEREYGKQIGFIVSEKEKYIRNIIQKYLEENCDYKGDFISKEEINVNNKALRNIFEDFGVTHKRDGLPSLIWNNASEEFRRGLIDGLFSSDGHIENDKRQEHQRICFTTSHEKMAKDVSELLGFYGIKNCISYKKRNSYTVNGKIYEKETEVFIIRINQFASIEHFRKLFKLTNKDKQELLNNYSIRKELINDKIKIALVEKTDIKEDVWDIRVDDETHCFQLAHCITGNCNEILLRPYEKCNLSEVVVRADDSLTTLSRKVKLAAIIGTLQSTLTFFPYLRKIWKINAEEERLLGVSLTGIYDCPLLNNFKAIDLPAILEVLKEEAISTNKEWAAKLGINQSTATTCVKPSGTVSSLVDCASGIHPRHAQFYLRRVRGDNKDPITKFMIEAGVPFEPDVTKADYTTVFTFPMKAPHGAITRDDISAIDHLELWRIYAKHYCEHKPSVTISVKDHEWPRVGGWVYDHFDEISGVSFLPYDGGTYRQAPFETINEEQYEKALEKMPETIDWDDLKEHQDNVEGIQQLACVSGGCDV